MVIKKTINIAEDTQEILNNLPKNFNISKWTNDIYVEYFSTEEILNKRIREKEKELNDLKEELSLYKKLKCANIKFNKNSDSEYTIIPKKQFLKETIISIEESPLNIIKRLKTFNNNYNYKLSKLEFMKLLDKFKSGDYSDK